jgi:diguanylate cyclase (GGDEF)-like protein
MSISPLVVPDKEARRLATLHGLGLLDSVPEAEYDAIVTLAAQLLDAPTAMIALVDSDRLWLKARYNVAGTQMPREEAFCNHTIAADAMLVVEDLSCDPRFADSQWVTGKEGFRFYAGLPIHADDGGGSPQPIGTLCVIDDRPRTLDEHGRGALRQLATLAEALVSAHATSRRIARIAELAESQSATLARQELIFRQAERMALIGSWRLSLADDHVSWSDGVYRIYDLPVGQMPLLSDTLSFYPPGARARVSEALAHTISTGHAFDFEEDFITATGNQRRVRSRGEREDVDGVPVAVVGVFQDITDHHTTTMQLRRTADIDDLTGIANRAAFNRTVSAAIEAAHVNRTRLLLALIDLDGFKEINDTLGHLAGDDVLRAVARRLQLPWLRASHAARLGGDEFALIVDDPELTDDPPAFAERLQAELYISVAMEGMTIAASGTVGTALLGAADGVRDFIHAADTDLYASKRRRIGNRRRTDRRDAA